MHETHLFNHLFKYLAQEEKQAKRKISKIYVTLSEFGGMDKEHFLEHFQQACPGKKWLEVEIEFKTVTHGTEFQISRIDFA